MMRAFGVFLVALLAFVVLTEAQRYGSSRNNNNRGPARYIPEQFFFWTRNLGHGRRSQERAYVPPGGNSVYGTSNDEVLASVGVTPSSSFFDFTNAVPIAIVAPLNESCYLTNSTSNQTATMDLLNAISGNEIPEVDALPLDGTAVPLSASEVSDLVLQHPGVATVCEGRDIVPTYPVGAAPVAYEGPTDTLHVFILNGAARLRVPRRNNENRRVHDSHHHRQHGYYGEDRDRRPKRRHHRHG